MPAGPRELCTSLGGLEVLVHAVPYFKLQTTDYMYQRAQLLYVQNRRVGLLLCVRHQHDSRLGVDSVSGPLGTDGVA